VYRNVVTVDAASLQNMDATGKRRKQNSKSCMLKKHKIPHCADVQCCVLEEERNRAWEIYSVVY